MTHSQQQALEASVRTLGFFKTANTIRDLYNADTITLGTARAALRYLRREQAAQLGTCSSFLFRV